MLIETLRYENGFRRLERHLARLRASAQELGYPFSAAAVRAALEEVVAERTGPWRVRLELGPDGGMGARADPLEFGPPEPVPVALARHAIRAGDPWRRHKSGRRAAYDAATRLARAHGWADVLFCNEHGRLAEGAISNLFVEGAGGLLTPPVSAGALPGVLRAVLLEEGRAVERELDPAELAGTGALWIGNSLRGSRRAHLVATGVDVWAVNAEADSGA